MKYDIIIWDFNGTILNDVDYCYEILVNLLNKYNVPLVSKQQYLESFTFPVKEYYRKVGFNVENGKYEFVSKDFFAQYSSNCISCPLYPNLIEVLEYIKENDYIQICLSASQIDSLIYQLKYKNIDEYFDAILGLSNIYATSKIQIGRDYLKEKKLENKKILCIGDTLHDLEVASSLNADCILMSYGHVDKKRLLESGVKVFDNLLELITYLKEKENES